MEKDRGSKEKNISRGWRQRFRVHSHQFKNEALLSERPRRFEGGCPSLNAAGADDYLIQPLLPNRPPLTYTHTNKHIYIYIFISTLSLSLSLSLSLVSVSLSLYLFHYEAVMIFFNLMTRRWEKNGYPFLGGATPSSSYCGKMTFMPFSHRACLFVAAMAVCLLFSLLSEKRRI